MDLLPHLWPSQPLLIPTKKILNSHCWSANSLNDLACIAAFLGVFADSPAPTLVGSEIAPVVYQLHLVAAATLGSSL